MSAPSNNLSITCKHKKNQHTWRQTNRRKVRCDGLLIDTFILQSFQNKISIMFFPKQLCFLMINNSTCYHNECRALSRELFMNKKCLLNHQRLCVIVKVCHFIQVRWLFCSPYCYYIYTHIWTMKDKSVMNKSNSANLHIDSHY